MSPSLQGRAVEESATTPSEAGETGTRRIPPVAFTSAVSRTDHCARRQWSTGFTPPVAQPQAPPAPAPSATTPPSQQASNPPEPQRPATPGAPRPPQAPPQSGPGSRTLCFRRGTCRSTVRTRSGCFRPSSAAASGTDAPSERHCNARGSRGLPQLLARRVPRSVVLRYKLLLVRRDSNSPADSVALVLPNARRSLDNLPRDLSFHLTRNCWRESSRVALVLHRLRASRVLVPPGQAHPLQDSRYSVARSVPVRRSWPTWRPNSGRSIAWIATDAWWPSAAPSYFSAGPHRARSAPADRTRSQASGEGASCRRHGSQAGHGRQAGCKSVRRNARNRLHLRSIARSLSAKASPLRNSLKNSESNRAS